MEMNSKAHRLPAFTTRPASCYFALPVPSLFNIKRQHHAHALKIAQSVRFFPYCLLILTEKTITSTGSLSQYQMDTDTSERISSKVRALLKEIGSNTNQKHVIFSAWTSSLDMVERGLDRIGVGFVRIDGKVATKRRGPIIERFRNQTSVRVILKTISCGALGLDVTAAS